ncbi:hypothetical protein [Acetobacter sicerae]|nr:hypothetical protein [Acetobacter sicerae]NHN93701.1 hypothetical protein [Acetobacter sicerae]
MSKTIILQLAEAFRRMLPDMALVPVSLPVTNGMALFPFPEEHPETGLL